MLFPYGSHHLAVFLFSFPPLPICCCCQLCFLLAGASHFSLAIQFAAVLLMEVQHFSEEYSLLWWWCELFGNFSKSCLCSVPVAHVHFMPCPSPLTVAPVVPKICCDLVARRGTGPWWGSGVEPASPGLASWLHMWLGLRLLSFLCLISPLERSFSFPYCLVSVQYKSRRSLKSGPDKLEAAPHLSDYSPSQLLSRNLAGTVLFSWCIMSAWFESSRHCWSWSSKKSNYKAISW